jgi:fibronectin-binding autotransporter adhesin
MQNSVQHIVLHRNKVAAKITMPRLLVRGLCALFGTVLYVSVALAQLPLQNGSLYINGTFVNAGTIRVNNHIVNNTAGPVSVLPGTTASRVRLTGASNVAGHTIYGGGPISFYRLDLEGGRETRLKVNVQVTNMFRIGYAGFTYTSPSDSGFTIENRTLTIDSVATYLGTGLLTFAGGTVTYDNTNPGSQTLLNSKAIYGTLNLSSGNTNYIIPSVGDGSFEAATVSHNTGTGSVTLNDSLKVTGSATFGTIADVASGKMLQLTGTTAPSTINTLTTLNGTIQKAGTQKLVITTVTTTIASGVIENTGTDSLAIRTLNGNVGTIRNTSTGFLAFNTPATNTGTISNTSTSSLTFYNTIANNGVAGVISNTSTGTVTFANNLTGTGTVSQTANGTINVGGSFTQNTYTLATFGTVVYNGTAAQSVIGTNYYNLTIATTVGNATASAPITLTTGNLVIISGSTLDMAGFTTSLFNGGTNNNLGTIKWSGTNVFVKGAGTTEFYSAAVGNVAAGTVTDYYGNLLFSGTGMKTFTTSPVTATGNMTVNSGAQVTVNNGVTVQVNGSTLLSGNITNNGAVNVGP